jgi:hypothetical protein
MELQKKVEVRALDAFFLGECIVHRKEGVQGVRELADFFTDKNVLNWYDKAKSQEMRHKNEEFRTKNK